MASGREMEQPARFCRMFSSKFSLPALSFFSRNEASTGMAHDCKRATVRLAFVLIPICALLKEGEAEQRQCPTVREQSAVWEEGALPPFLSDPCG